MTMSKCLFLTAALLAAVVLPASAQKANDPGSGTFIGGPKEKKEKTPTSRSLKGTVTDETGKPLEGALVILTNNNTKEKLNFFTKKDGRYQFADLSFTQDYEVVAQYKDELSAVRKMSQYDRRPSVVHVLAVNPQSPSGKPKDSAQAAPANPSTPQ
jgi:hypothetical protein